jgi:polyisoprenoid-binding protein YceI
MRTRLQRSFSIVTTALGLALASGAFADPQIAPGGKTLVISDSVKALGTVYYTTPGRGMPMRFTSTGAAAKVTGSTKNVIGYAVLGPKDNPAALKAGEFVLPVASIELKSDEAGMDLKSPLWLDAAKNANITFKLKEVKNIAAKESKGAAKDMGQTFGASIEGELSIKGVTKSVTINDATIRVIEGNEKTAMVFAGDILAVRGRFDITLADFAITNDAISMTKKVGETAQVSLNVDMFSVEPDKQPELPQIPAKPADAPKTIRPGEGGKPEVIHPAPEKKSDK